MECVKIWLNHFALISHQYNKEDIVTFINRQIIDRYFGYAK